MPTYPPLQQTEPMVLTHEDRANIESAMQQLAISDAMIQRMERCKLPCNAQRADCDAVCSFFQAILGEYFGHNSPMPHKGV